MADELTHNDQTMATLAQVAAKRFGSVTAAKYLRDGDWRSVTFDEFAHQVEATALGLVELGVGVGDRVAVLCNTRYEFLVVELAITAAGAVVVPVFPTNSAEECEWVIGNAGSVVLVVEDADQFAKVSTVRDNLPELRHVLIVDGAVDDVLSLDALAALGAGQDVGTLRDRAAAVGLDDPCLIIYTSGTTGRPKGVVLTHRGFAAGRQSAAEMSIIRSGEVVYLYLPLAHVFGQLVVAVALEVGATVAFWGGDPTSIVAELGQVKPEVLPSVPRIFEKVYAAAMGMIAPDQAEEVAHAIELGVRVRDARLAGADVSAEDAAAFEQVDAELFPLVRGIFGGQISMAISGAAPIAPEILRFFYACGVPVMEGWGMTETTGIGTVNLPGQHRFGSIGRSIAGADIRIAADAEIQMAGPMQLKEYWRNPEATAEAFTDDGYLRTGDLGSIDDDGYVFITGRKKDIIITAGGKNLTPANLEGDLRRSRWISQVVMFGDRKPYPVAVVTLDAEVVVPWAQERGVATDLASLSRNEELIGYIQAELDDANSKYARVEQIKRFVIIDRDFTIESGELTPSLKLKRNVVYANLADVFEGIYEKAESGSA